MDAPASTTPTDQDLSRFHRWLRRRGRSEGTANSYTYQVQRSYADEDPFERLIDHDLSPNYVHTIASALKAWAKFTHNDELALELSEIQLPPARRLKEKPALDKAIWLKLIDEIEEADYIYEPQRAVLGAMACRGFRRGDLLRLRKKDVASALDSGTLVFEAKGRRRLEFPVGDNWGWCLELLMAEGGRRDWGQVWDLVAPGSKLESRPEAAGAAVTRALTMTASEIGIDEIHPHLLRKTYATHYYSACQDPVKLKDHMQWASIETAMLYVAKSSRQELEAVADSLFQ